VHAIALCNMAELSAGVMAEATLSPDMRWIPKGMSVEYLSKARGTMRAIATPETSLVAADTGVDWPVIVQVVDPTGHAVFRARITMWVSPRS
jgi:uncharacterized protein DUF4442